MNRFSDLIKSENELLDILMKVYRKFKSFVYFSNNLSQIKQLISDFEWDNNLFDDRMNKLAHALWFEDYYYFETLIHDVKFYVLPKLTTSRTDDSKENIIITGNDSKLVPIEKINFFINAGVELYILDTFWTILLGRMQVEDYRDFTYLRANVFDYGLYDVNNKNLIESINFISINIFKKYYPEYASWKNGAIEKVQELYERQSDAIILSMDIKSYYYNVDLVDSFILNFFSTRSPKLLDQYKKFSFIENIMNKVYKSYSKLINPYLTSNNKYTMLPIGLLSSAVIGNLFLYEFDNSIKEHYKVVYYSRYVDDVIIVIKPDSGEVAEKDILIKTFPNCFTTNGEMLQYRKIPSIQVQNNKTKIIHFSHHSSKEYITRLKIEIGNPSEPHLLPDVSIDIDDFLKQIIKKDDDSIKIRDTRYIDINQKSLIGFIGSYLLGSKSREGEYQNTLNKEKRNEIYKQITRLLTFTRLIQLYARWEVIFSFFILNENNLKRIQPIFQEISNGIDHLQVKLNNDYNKNRENEITKKLKDSLKTLLRIQLSSVCALNKQIRGISKFNFPLKSIASKILKSNMFNHALLSIPFINYLNGVDLFEGSLYKASTSKLTKFFSSSNIDYRKIQLSPKFIHHSDIAICEYLFSDKPLSVSGHTKRINDKYKSVYAYFGNPDDIEKNIQIKSIPSDQVELEEITFPNNQLHRETSDTYIGLANINVSKHKPIYKDKINLNPLRFLNKQTDLYDILNNSYIYSTGNRKLEGLFIYGMEVNTSEEKLVPTKIQFVIFPEVSIPYEWIKDVVYFSRRSGISIIFGLKHIVKGNQMINAVATVIPCKGINNYNSAYLFIREKNDYSYIEKVVANNSGLKCVNAKVPFYQVFDWLNTKFSVFNCFEITDINARASMINLIDLIISIQYNNDVNYFSSIAESTAREAYCYVAQVNSSNLGGTEIIGPFHGYHKNIISISGGEKNTVHIGKINIPELKNFLNEHKRNGLKDLKNIEKEYKDKIKKHGFEKFEKYAAPSARLKK